ncbi:hypothetical protein CDAR_476941 [Caerostris darwini]|uniref:Uncharacterized protein n=1 Tax=Caerostris darwini TaxID=1538125 RepID=A0AAV4TRK6_9ARAC|nr:hypothetical protein CDAR_476941 [Caerostris darwini]
MLTTYQQSDIKEQLGENWKNTRRNFSDSVAVEEIPFHPSTSPPSSASSSASSSRDQLGGEVPHPAVEREQSVFQSGLELVLFNVHLLATTYQQCDIKEQLAENWKNPRRHFSDSVAVEDLPESGSEIPFHPSTSPPSSLSSSASSSPSSSRDQFGGEVPHPAVEREQSVFQSGFELVLFNVHWLATTYQQSDIKEQLAENWKNPRRHFSDSVAVEDLPESGSEIPFHPSTSPPSSVSSSASSSRDQLGGKAPPITTYPCDIKEQLAENWKNPRRHFFDSVAVEDLPESGSEIPFHPSTLPPSSFSSSASSSPSSTRGSVGRRSSASRCRERTERVSERIGASQSGTSLNQGVKSPYIHQRHLPSSVSSSASSSPSSSRDQLGGEVPHPAVEREQSAFQSGLELALFNVHLLA